MLQSESHELRVYYADTDMRIFLDMPPRGILLERLSYDQESGKLFWKVAPRSVFRTDGAWKRFNSTRAGNEAGHKHSHRNGERHAIVIRGTFSGEDCWFVAHRIIYAMMGVEVPAGMEIDHKNRDPWDNRWDNLRIATPTQNSFNSLKGSRSRTEAGKGLPKGVSPQAGRFKAQICINGKKRHIGMYATPEEAAQAYRAAAMPQHGEFFCQA